jgi:hypothetical protein
VKNKVKKDWGCGSSGGAPAFSELKHTARERQRERERERERERDVSM